ncbi:MAG: T9SS type A sorting domain-containing protein [Cryomorphaceae bacterium]|nr:T9SS type A sorting domain-containing protein [Cryomorphaceae bacterium]
MKKNDIIEMHQFNVFPALLSLKVELFTLVFSFLLCSQGHAQTLTLETQWHSTTSRINALHIDSSQSMLFIGGSHGPFVDVNDSAGIMHAFDFKGKRLIDDFPKTRNSSVDIVSDGEGGWYVGSGLVLVNNETRYGVTKIDKNGKLSNWTLNLSSPRFSIVNRLFKNDDKLYIVGVFTEADGQPRNGIAAVDLTTHTLTNFSIDVAGDSIWDMTFTDDEIYINGTFNYVEGQKRTSIAAVDKVTGALLPWKIDVEGFVTNMEYCDVHERFFIAGNFSSVGGQQRSNFASFDKGDTVVNSFNPSFTGGDDVFHMLVVGDSLFIAGNFTEVNNIPAGHIACINLSTETVVPMGVTVSGNTFAGVGLMKYSNNKIYFMGNFNSINGQQTSGIGCLYLNDFQAEGHFDNRMFPARFDVYEDKIGISNTIPLPFKPQLGTPYFSAFDLETKLPIDLNVSITGVHVRVNTILEHNDLLYVGGQFNNVNGAAQHNLLIYDPQNDSVLSWQPIINGEIHALHVVDDTLYVGGAFDTINGVPHKNLAAFDLATQSLSSWNPEPNDEIHAITSSDVEIMVAGCFTQIDNQNRTGLAIFDKSSKSISTANPLDNPNSFYCLFDAKVIDNKLYVTGHFNVSFGSEIRNMLAVFSLGSMQLSPIRIIDYDMGHGHKVDYYEGDLVVCGSMLSTLSSDDRGVARLDTSTGNLVPWFEVKNTVFDFAFGYDRIFIGGSITNNIFSNEPRRNFRVYSNQFVWEGTNNSNWNVASNWSNNQVPPQHARILFSPSAENNLHLNQNTSVEFINFNHSKKLLNLNGYNLTSEQIHLYNRESFVRTSGNGFLKLSVPENVETTFPVGIEALNSVDLTTYLGDTFSVRVLDSVYNVSQNDIEGHYLNMSWQIKPNGSIEDHHLNMIFRWNKSRENSVIYDASLQHHFDGFWRHVWGDTKRAGFLLYHNQYNNRGEYFTIVSSPWTKLGLDEKTQSEERFTVHPNPCSDVFKMSYQADHTFTTEISLVSMDGRTVYHQTHTFSPGENGLNIGVGQLPSGVYVLKLINDKNREEKRKIVVK